MGCTAAPNPMAYIRQIPIACAANHETNPRRPPADHRNHPGSLQLSGRRFSRRHPRPRCQPEHRCAAAAYSGRGAARHSRFRLRSRSRFTDLHAHGPQGSRPGRFGKICANGPRGQWLRGLAAGLPEARSAGRAFRRDLCQRSVVPHPAPGVTSGVDAIARGTETGWCAVQFQSPGREPGRLERAAVWGVSRSSGVAAVAD
ncbi:hypothetical protein D3C85_1271190 [compost metagenome]